MSSRSDGFFPQAETRTPYEKGYQQGRADAIDEITKKVHDELESASMIRCERYFDGIDSLDRYINNIELLRKQWKEEKMINTKGEWIYTNEEISYELGLSPETINSIGKKLYGINVTHWTIREVKIIAEYIKSISIEENSKRLQLLHDTIAECGFEPFKEDELKAIIAKDIR